MKYIFIAFLFIQYFDVFSQSKNNAREDTVRTAILEINPYGTDLSRVFVKYGGNVKFKITHVNQFKIQGSNSAVRQSISFDAPQQFALPSPSTQSGDNLKEAFNKKNDSISNYKISINAMEDQLTEFKSMKPHGVQATESPKFTEIIQKLNKDISNTKNKILALQNQINSLKDSIALRDSIDDNKTKFIRNYNAFIIALNKIVIYTSIENYIDTLLQDTFIPDTEILKSNLDNYLININDENSDINLIRKKCVETLDDLTNSYIIAKSAYDELAKKIKSENLKLKGELTNKDNSVKLKIDSVVGTFEREKYFEKEFQFLSSKFDAINSENKRKDIINKTNAGIDVYYKVKNCNFEVYTDAEQIDDDLVTITPQLKNNKGDVIKEFKPIKIKSYGGIKVDFSSGYLLSFLGNQNFTNLYDSSGIVGVQKNKTDNLTHAIGVLFNVYPRSRHDINPGFSFGVSIPTDGISVGFYGGASLLMLEKNRLILSAGIAYNKIKILNTGNLLKNEELTKISGKETYKFSNSDFKEINYDDIYKPSFFIGLTYNIFTLKK